MVTISAIATPKAATTSISFITPYMPIICGIADYTGFITRECLPGRWNVLSFDLANYGVPLSSWQARPGDPVRYCIPSRSNFSASSVLEALNPDEDQVLWFQHEFGIWSNNQRFVGMLRDLDYPKVVTLHTLHFQSDETVYGLRREEHSFLRMLLPYTDAITVFSNGVYKAVTQAFPQYRDKVHVLRHGTHLYPAVSTLSRVEAKERLHEYLVFESRLNMASKDRLEQYRILLDPETTLVGGAGFITASKGTDLLYDARDALQEMLPGRRIAAIYVGHLREPDNTAAIKCAEQLRAKCNGSEKSFLETYMPVDMLALLLRALDVYFYWPSDCTQSGILAHALGAGATMACRDMEGVGETVRLGGGLAHADLGSLLVDIKELIVDPRLSGQLSENALRYADKFSWGNQALRHSELAAQLCPSRGQSIRATSLLDYTDSSARVVSIAI